MTQIIIFSFCYTNADDIGDHETFISFDYDPNKDFNFQCGEFVRKYLDKFDLILEYLSRFIDFYTDDYNPYYKNLVNLLLNKNPKNPWINVGDTKEFWNLDQQIVNQNVSIMKEVIQDTTISSEEVAHFVGSWCCDTRNGNINNFKLKVSPSEIKYQADFELVDHVVP